MYILYLLESLLVVLLDQLHINRVLGHTKYYNPRCTLIYT